MIYSCFVSYLTYMIVDRFGTVLSFYVLYYCIIIQCSSYLATWLPFLINRLDWIGLVAGATVSDRRSALDSDTVEQILFVHSNS